MKVKVSGGTIENNTARMDGDAISLEGENENYPSMELSGSPTISGSVFLYDKAAGPVIHITGAFTPTAPIGLSPNGGDEGTVAVTYADGLTPDLSHFTSLLENLGLKQNGQNLEWAKKVQISFKSADNKTTYKKVYVLPGDTINATEAPAPTQTGYTLSGWRRLGYQEAWDFATDVVEERMTLVAVWALNAPTVNVEAELLTPHEGTEAVLTATAGHELGNVTYSYQWYKDGVAITDATADTLNVSEAGSYTVKVKASDGTLVSAETESEPIVITIGGHIFDDEWKYDEETHWRECVICEEKNEEAEHSFVWVIDKEATNYETGLKHEECAVCGYAKGPVEIPMTSIPGSNQGQVGGGDWDWPEGSGSTGSGNAGGTGDSTDDGKLPPNTGDTSGVALGVAILALAGVGISTTAIHGKKKK